MSTGTIIGIDFGTTSSEVAVFRSGRAQVLSTPEGERIIPSVVYLDEEGRHFVGQAAKNVALLHPERTVLSAKRELGDPKRQATKRAAALAYGLASREEGTILVYDLGGGTFDISILHSGGGQAGRAADHPTRYRSDPVHPGEDRAGQDGNPGVGGQGSRSYGLKKD